MKLNLRFMAILFFACAAIRAQENSAATSTAASAGPVGLAVDGTLHYDLRYSETCQLGGGQDSQQESYASGDASYANINKRYPFTLQYGGGYGWLWAGQPSAGNVFQHLSLSQGMLWRSWNFSASDNVSYTFQTPTTGFSGVPGTGEPIGGPGSTTQTDQTILTVNTRTLDNATTAGVGHRLDHATTLSFGGVIEQLRYIDDNGQDLNTLAATASLSRRLNARNSVSGAYSFSRYDYLGAAQASALQLSYGQANAMQVSFHRQWNAKFSTGGSFGPQWISSSNSAILPSSTRYSAGALAAYVSKFGNTSIFYSHGVSGGAGYLLGAESDSAGANFSRSIGRNLSVGLTGSYMRTAGLDGSGAVHAEYGGAQATRRLGRTLSLFANYTVADQSSSLQNTPNLLNSLSQVIGFGIGYSPRELHFKR
ncbi:MAG TPA: hypothetical protein VGF01_20390 [Terracidiphilus sp.]